MVGSILKALNLDPTIIVGGVVKSLESNSVLGSGETFVVEADEYNKSLLHLNPTIAVINNIDFEHIECYKDLNELKETFLKFANSVPFYGKVCVCLDSNNIASIITRIDKPLISFGIENSDVDIKAEDIQQKNGTVSFNVKVKDKKYSVNLSVPGKYNVYNALAALSVCETMGIDIEKACKALSDFGGVKRRFDIKVDKRVMIVDDYAHHPVEVQNVVETVKDNWDTNLNVIFQPHLYSRTKEFYKEFANALMSADNVMITEIFASREKGNESINSNLIINEMLRLNHKNVSFVSSDEIVEKVKTIAKDGDIFLTMGAGNIWRFAEELGKHFND
jgi:UDP-N-acetylmuramate--alanine ligase